MKKICLFVVISIIAMGMMFVVAEAEDVYNVTVSEQFKILVNGKEITTDTTVKATDYVKLSVEDKSICLVGIDNVYYDVNKSFKLTGDADFKNAVVYKLGLSMVNGAQVRVGSVDLEAGKISTQSDSGLRFIATCDYTDTIIAESGIEFGIKITAEESDKAVYIKAEKFQYEDNSVFSAAITNIAESNYNRRYIASGYAKVTLFDSTEKEIVTDTVTRSIYQVSAGVMKNSSAEGNENLPYSIDGAVRSVLNAYINQTGIRLTYSQAGDITARVNGKGSYSGDVFFDVSSSVNENGDTDVVITPLGVEDGFGNEVEIEEWWMDYIRVNNNNSAAKTYISNAKLENNTLSFTFALKDKSGYTFDQEDNVTVVSEVTKTYIRGFKAGEEVQYALGEKIYLMGLAESMDDIVPGSVVLIAEEGGECKAIELLASLGMPINGDFFESNFGVYDASDGSSKYKNVVTEMFSKSGSKLVCRSLPDTTKTTYYFESTNSMCYRVGIAMSANVPKITVTGKNIGAYPTIFENTSSYHNYLYLRYNTETGKVQECVFYCVPKDLDFTGGGEYSDIFSLEDYRIIIE